MLNKYIELKDFASLCAFFPSMLCVEDVEAVRTVSESVCLRLVELPSFSLSSINIDKYFTFVTAKSFLCLNKEYVVSDEDVVLRLNNMVYLSCRPTHIVSPEKQIEICAETSFAYIPR
jgi:hypothetical protein